MRRTLIAFLLLFFTLLQQQKSLAQRDSLLIDFLLNRIAEQQANQNPDFLTGLFPSYISGTERFSSKHPDNSIFFTGLIDLTLQKIKPALDKGLQQKIDSIIFKSLAAFPHFKNQKGRNTYNFWRTDTQTVYPYAGWLFNKNITLPDDMDDTVISLMVQKANDSTAQEVHKLMQSFTNNGKFTLRNPIPEFDTIPAYSTWFGKKFPVVFDISVLSNILTFVQFYHLTWTGADSASLRMIVKAIENDYHISQPIYVSPYYPKTALILYHISRMMRSVNVPELNRLKIKMITDAAIGFERSDNLVEKIIYSSAILNWGYIPPEIWLPDQKDVEKLVERSNYSFFLGNIPSYFPDLYKKLATKKGLGLFYHYCPAYYDLLLLEYIILKNN